MIDVLRRGPKQKKRIALLIGRADEVKENKFISFRSLIKENWQLRLQQERSTRRKGKRLKDSIFLFEAPIVLRLPIFFAVGRGVDRRLVGFLALRPPTSDSVRIRVSPTLETSGANESTFFFGD